MSEATFSTAGNGDQIRDRFAVFVNSEVYNRGHRVLMAMVDFRGDIVHIAKQLQFEPHTDLGGYIAHATIDGPAATEFLQAALEAAWAAGLRPKNWRDERPEQVKAMDNHLQDMRRLVFGRPPTPSMTDVLFGKEPSNGD